MEDVLLEPTPPLDPDDDELEGDKVTGGEMPGFVDDTEESLVVLTLVGGVLVEVGALVGSDVSSAVVL